MLPGGIERVADVPIHFADPLVRRSPALQQAADSAAPTARMNAAMLARNSACRRRRLE
jgi:NADH-quinone oxidoreductase subunit G